RCRRDQEDILFLPAREAAVLEQNRAHERNLGFDQIGPGGLGDVEIWQKSQLLPHSRECGKVFFVEWRIPQVCHLSPQAKQCQDYRATAKNHVKSGCTSGRTRCLADSEGHDWVPIPEVP